MSDVDNPYPFAPHRPLPAARLNEALDARARTDLANITGGATPAIYYAHAYGGVWNGASSEDVGVAINAAIAAAAAGGGGEVHLPAGTYYHASLIDITSSHIALVGAGSVTEGSGGAAMAGSAGSVGTILKWNGAVGGRMLAASTATGQLIGNSVRGVTFDGNAGRAADGIYAASLFRFDLIDIGFQGGFSGGNILNLDVLNATAGGIQDGTIDGLFINNAGYTSNQLRFGCFIDSGGVHGNAAYCVVRRFFIGGDSGSTGILCVGCDNISFHDGRIFNAGTSIDLSIAVSGAQMFATNGVEFSHVQYTGAAIARGSTSFPGAVAYSTATHNNWIEIDQTNATPQPTVEAAADLHWSSNSGYSSGLSFIGKTGVQPAFWAAYDYSIWGQTQINALAYDPSGVAYLANSGAGGLVSFDSIVGDRFRIAFTGSSGAKNVLLSRLAGTGTFEFADVLQLDNGTTGKGTHATAAYNSGSFGQFVAEAEDYAATSNSVVMLQYGSAATGTTLGLANAHLGLLGFLNTSNAAIYTNNSTPITFGVNGATVFSLTAGGIDLVAGKSTILRPGTAPASPSSGWAFYVDSGDGNKLKAKASTGTTVTLGTP